MGAGGAAPPVRSEHVMILVGATNLQTIFVVQAWSIPTNIGCSKDEDGKEECETYSVKYELSEGDIFTLEVVEGEVRPTVVLPDGSKSFENNQEGDWTYEATSSGVHTFQLLALEDSAVDYSVSRGILIDYALYPIGALILVFGILKKYSNKSENEPVEALLED